MIFGLSRLLIMVTLMLGLMSGSAQAQLVVVVNARSGVATMTQAEVVSIFFGRYRQFFNGTEASPVDLIDTNPDRARFYAALVGKDIAEVNAYWSRQLFSGRMQPYPKVSNQDEVMKWVVAHPGGIGFIDISKVDGRVRVVYELKRESSGCCDKW